MNSRTENRYAHRGGVLILTALFALLLWRQPPITETDESWRLFHIATGRMQTSTLSLGAWGVPFPAPAPHGYIQVHHLLWRAAGGDVDRFFIAQKLLALALAALLVHVLTDTAFRLGATGRQWLLFLPLLAWPAIWHQYAVLKEYLLAGVLLALYGRALLGQSRLLASDLQQVFFLPLIGFVSPAAGMVALWMAGTTALHRRRWAPLRNTFLLFGLILAEHLAAPWQPPCGSLWTKAVFGLRTGIIALVVQFLLLVGLGADPLALPLHRYARYLLLLPLLCEVLRASQDRRLRLLAWWAIGWVIPYLALRLRIESYHPRYMFFYVWFWLPVLLAATGPPTGWCGRGLRGLAAALFLVLATHWLFLCTTARPRPISAVWAMQEARRETAARPAPWVFIDSIHRHAAAVQGWNSPYVLVDTSWLPSKVLSPEYDDVAIGTAFYRNGDEIPLRDAVQARQMGLREFWVIAPAGEGHARWLSGQRERLAARLETRREGGHGAVWELWSLTPDSAQR